MNADAHNTIIVVVKSARSRTPVKKALEANGWSEVNWLQNILHMVVHVPKGCVAEASAAARDIKGVITAYPNANDKRPLPKKRGPAKRQAAPKKRQLRRTRS